jgi:hypothetical protein
MTSEAAAVEAAVVAEVAVVAVAVECWVALQLRQPCVRCCGVSCAHRCLLHWNG